MHFTHPRRLRSRPILWLVVPAIGALAVGGRALGEDTADPVDPVEDKALREESQANFEQSLETFKQAFDACVQQAKSGKPGDAVRARNLARAEVILEKIDALSETITKRGDTEKFLSKYDSEALGPVLEGAVRYERAQDLLAGGDRESALKILEPLGLVRHFWIVGPFDNERGRGFNTPKDPGAPEVAIEKKIDLAAKYKGKERQVAWREAQIDQTLGYVNLDAMLRPNDMCAAYAVAFVKADADVDAAVRLGSDEAVRAWWNGKEVLTRNIRRLMGFDQDVVGVKVKAGWNMLLVKVHDQSGEWGFRARLTAADGSPLKGVTIASSRAEADEALKTKFVADAAAVVVDGGAKQFYDSVAGQSGGTAARDLFHLGYLHFRRHFDSFADRKAENILQKACETEPDNAIFRFHFAEAAAPPIEMIVEKEENRQRAGREKAIETDPKYAVAYRALASYYTTSLVNLERAEQLLRKALEVNPDFWQARLDLAGVLERRGLKAAGGAERDKALSSAKASGVEEAARASASQTDKNGMGPDAATAWRDVLKLDERSNDVRRRVAELAAQALDATGAIGVLDEIVKWNPYDTGALSRKAEILEGAGDFKGAEAALGDALKIAPEDDDLLQSLGRVQRKAGEDKAALATFREALRVNPKLQSLERYVEFLDPEAAPYEDDFHVDVAPLVEKAKGYDNKENDGYVTLLDQTVTKVNSDGTQSNYVHMAAKILTDAGVKQYDKYYARAWDEALKWKVARVLRWDEKSKQYKTLDAKTQNQVCDFPPLEKGDVIDVEYRRDEREQSFFGDYFGEEMFFADSVPIFVSQWTLLTPAERPFYFHERNMDVKPAESTRDDGKTRVFTWRREDIAKVKDEIAMPGMRELAPQVQVTTYKDWDEFAKWWSATIREQYILSDEMKAKVKELTAGKESRMDKIRAIYDFVTGEITYRAWEFGIHGYKPYTATQIFEGKNGDCKDKALVFNTLLKEIGVEGYPALLYADNSRDEEDLSLAMLGDFNHCIAYVPDTDGKGTPMFFDGTAEYASAFLPPMMDQGAQALIVKPDGAQIITIPRGGAEKTGVVQKWHVKVHDDGSATAELERTQKGDFAVMMRQMFSVEGQRPLMLQRLFAPVFGKFKIAEQKFDDLKDLSKPEASFRLKLEIDKFVKKSGDGMTVPADFSDMLVRSISGMVKQMVSLKQRERDLVTLSSGLSFHTEVDYELPDGWSVVAPPQNQQVDLPAAGFTSTASSDGTKLHLVRDMRLTGERVKPAEYAAFREAITKGIETSQQQWQVKKGEAPAPQAPATPAEKPPEAGSGK